MPGQPKSNGLTSKDPYQGLLDEIEAVSVIVGRYGVTGAAKRLGQDKTYISRMNTLSKAPAFVIDLIRKRVTRHVRGLYEIAVLSKGDLQAAKQRAKAVALGDPVCAREPRYHISSKHRKHLIKLAEQASIKSGKTVRAQDVLNIIMQHYFEDNAWETG